MPRIGRLCGPIGGSAMARVTMQRMPTPARAATDADRGRRRARLRAGARVVAAVAVVVALYVALVLTYAFSDAATVDRAAVARPAGGVTVVLTARSITAAGATMRVDVSIDPDESLLGPDGYPSRPITVSVDPTEEDADLVFEAGRRPQARQLTLLFDGDIQDWPFDRYAGSFSAVVTAGQGAQAVPVDSVIELDGSVQGWDLAADTQAPDLLVDVSFHRSSAIMLFGLTLVLVLILLPVACWIVQVRLYRDRRLFEAGMLGWTAALLFATIPIRNFFPGSPPPGSWVDVLVVLWMVVALTAALFVGVAAWIRSPRPSP